MKRFRKNPRWYAGLLALLCALGLCVIPSSAATLLLSTGSACFARINGRYAVCLRFDVNSTTSYTASACVTQDEQTVLTFAPQYALSGNRTLRYQIPFEALEAGEYLFSIRAVMRGGEEKTVTYRFSVSESRKNFSTASGITAVSYQCIERGRYMQKTVFTCTKLPAGSELVYELLDEDDVCVRTVRLPIPESECVLEDTWDLSECASDAYTGRYHIEYEGKSSLTKEIFFYPMLDEE